MDLHRSAGVPIRTHALAAVFFLIWSLVLLGSVWTHPRTRLPADAGDPVLNLGILHWNAITPPFTEAWWNFPSFAPLEGTGGLTENLLATSVIATPVIALTGDPVLAYNATVLGAFALSGMAMYALVFWLSRSVTAGLIAGIAFGFSPFRAVHLSHLQTLWTCGMPLALLGLHMFFAGGRGRALALFAAGWLLTILGSLYYVVFLGTYLACWLAWFGSPRPCRGRAAAVCGVGVLASVPILPLVVTARDIQARFGLSRTPTEIRGFSADVAGFFHASPLAPVASALTTAEAAEGSLFPGVLVLVLCVAGLWLTLRRHRAAAGRPLRFSKVVFALGLCLLAVATYAATQDPIRTTVLGITIAVSTPSKPLSMGLLCMVVAAATTPAVRAASAARDTLFFYLASVVLMFLFALGPEPTLNGAPILYGTPYRWLLAIPGIQGLRVPARFWMLGIAALSVGAGLTAATLASRVRVRAARIAGPAVAIALLVEGWMTIPAVAAPAWRGGGPREAAAVVLELPAGTVDLDAAAQARAVAGRYRAVNGYSGYFPPHYPALVYGLRVQDAQVLAGVRAGRPVYVSLAPGDTEHTAWLHTLGVDAPALTGTGGRDFYRLAALPEAVAPPPMARALLTGIDATCNPDLLPSVTDGALDTRWQCGPQIADQTLTFDLGHVGTLTGIAHTLGPFYYDFPRRLTVEVAADLGAWRQVYAGATAAETMRAALADPRQVELQVRFPPTDARYVRLTQTGRDPAVSWSVAEIAALVP